MGVFTGWLNTQFYHVILQFYSSTTQLSHSNQNSKISLLFFAECGHLQKHKKKFLLRISPENSKDKPFKLRNIYRSKKESYLCNTKNKVPEYQISPFTSLQDFQKQPPRGVPWKRCRCSENMQEVYIRTPTPKCDFDKFAKQLY